MESAAKILPAVTIIGAGRIGQAIADINTGDKKDVVVRRGEPVHGPLGPIIICTRNDDLEQVVASTPPDRCKDLVFIQNGMLQPWLEARGLGDNTQVLVYFAVAKKGDLPVDGKTDVNPEGLTAACGPHAVSVAQRLHAGGLSCKVLGPLEFKQAMLEKLVWICAFMLLGVKYKESVGGVGQKHQQELTALMTELAQGGAAQLGISLQPGTVERLMAYGRAVAHYPTAIKEFSWRNGWFWGVSQRAAASGQSDPFPTHTALCREVVDAGELQAAAAAAAAQ